MAASVSKQTSNISGSNIYINSCVYKAAIWSEQKVETSELQENLYRLTPGGGNTVLHLASAAGNFNFIKEILNFNLRSGFVETVNANGNTALHEAAQKGHYEVVELLLRHSHSLVSIHNNLRQTSLFKACEGGKPKIVEKLLEADPSKLLDKSLDGRTCLHVVVSRGDADLLKYLLIYIEKNLGSEKENLLKETDGQGNTVLHLAVKRNRIDMVKKLLKYEPGLCYSLNLDKETPICVAVKLGFPQIVEALLNCCPESIEIASKNRKNILHLAVELSQVKILKSLVEKKVNLSQLINQPDEDPPKDNTLGQEDANQSDKLMHIANRIEKVENVLVDLSQRINQPDEAPPKDNTTHSQTGGDTPLHIAVRNKNVYMVDLLLKVTGVNKEAVNSAGLTPLDIARENTEYHEPYKIIEKLSHYPRGRRPFLYNAPSTSPQKQKEAVKMVDRVFADRRNVDLVVAALLATMTFTAVFTVPGGFHDDPPNEGSGNAPAPAPTPTNEDSFVLGMPVLIGYDSFKLFLIFDCVAFYLSLFVVLMWEMSAPLTTRDKMLFMCVNNAVLCTAFAFTAYGLMVAVYTVLPSTKTFAWILLGSSMFIALCGTGTFFYMAAKFTVMRARFHHLCGVPRLMDDIAESIWVMAETHGILDTVRPCEDCFRSILWGHIPCKEKPTKGSNEKPKKGSSGNKESGDMADVEGTP